MSCDRKAELFWPDHDPDEQLDYDIDFTDAIPSTDSIDSVIVQITPDTTPNALSEVTTTIDPGGRIVTVWLSGGLAGTPYEVNVKATTSNVPARILNWTVNIKVKEH